MEVQKATDEEKGWSTRNDTRVTKVGKVIRKTSLDELPQLFTHWTSEDKTEDEIKSVDNMSYIRHTKI